MNLDAELARFNSAPALQAWVREALARRDSELAKRDSELAQKESDLDRRSAELKLANQKIQALTLELAHHKRIRFGRKNEQLSGEQRELFEETWNVDQAAMQAEVEQSTPKEKRPRSRAGRQALPDHLPRIEHHHEPESCTCGQCGQALVKIGEDVSEQLDVEPARFFVHRHIRPQYACRHCETVVAEPVPPALIEGGMAAPGLLAWIACLKFLDHLPLYRIEQIGARGDVPLPRSTLANWVGQVGVALQPLADRLAERLRSGQVIHADETPVAQLDPGRGKTLRAYLWAYRSNELEGAPPIVVFDYQCSRAGAHARAFLSAWRGHLMVDDYAGYKAMFTGAITELACLAHARRKFFELSAANQSPIAQEALRRIAALYAVEAQAREQGADALARAELRRTQARPELDSLFAWLTDTRVNVAPGSATAKAIDYTLRRWPALARYAESGILPIDNNPVENAIRPIAIGKKNWLYAGSERAGRRAAAIQSLLGTARLNGIEPLAWLKDTLEKLPTWPNSRIDELLPLRAEEHNAV